jgi:hypothetical protein
MVLNRLLTFALCCVLAHALVSTRRQRLEGQRVWREALAG